MKVIVGDPCDSLAEMWGWDTCDEPVVTGSMKKDVVVLAE